jgi:probable F420-dependent oxidoreductase
MFRMPLTPELTVTLQNFSSEPTDWSSLFEITRAADDAGIDRLILSDHVVFGENLEAYGDPAKGGSAGGRQPTGPDGLWLEPLTTIAYLSALTSRVRFGSNILIAALRRPVVLAKEVATIDVLSGGRLDLGVGVGWQREEYEAAGLSYEGRGRLLDRTLEVCQILWREQTATYSSDELSFENIHLMPKPLQSGGVPIWVSGTVNPRAMDRLARFGSGWIPWGDDAKEIDRGVARMSQAMNDRGRDPSDLRVAGGLRLVTREDRSLDLRQSMEEVPRLREIGVTDFRIYPRFPSDGKTEFLAEIVESFRSAAAED